MNFQLSRHAQEEMLLRGIPLALVESVLEHPQQIVPEYGDKEAYQSKIAFGSGKIFLLRVIVAKDVEPPEVVTLYRTTKIEKYWREAQ